MSSYASGTSVSIIQSINELDKLVTRHGATGFAYGRDESTPRTRVMFRIADRMVRMEVEKPSVRDFMRTPSNQRRTEIQATKAADDEEKRRWRALVLVVKALLVGVAEGVISLSDAFLAYSVLPNGVTVGEWSVEQLDTVYATAQMPALLPGSATGPRAIAS